MDQLSDNNNNIVRDLSSSNPSYAVGSSADEVNVMRGVVWNVDDGTIMADLGPLAFPHAINSSGDMAVGTRKAFSIPPVEEPIVWWTADGWENYEAISLYDILAVVPGGEHWAEITAVGEVTRAPGRESGADGFSSPQGINRHGQIVAVGKLRPEAPIEQLTSWSTEIATGLECINESDFPCGIPFILDTLPFLAVMRADVDNNGEINNLDITPFIIALAASGDEQTFLDQVEGGSFASADANMDGVVNNLDITVFIGILASAATSAFVPEPATLILFLVLLAPNRLRSRTRY